MVLQEIADVPKSLRSKILQTFKLLQSMEVFLEILPSKIVMDIASLGENYINSAIFHQISPCYM